MESSFFLFLFFLKLFFCLLLRFFLSSNLGISFGLNLLNTCPFHFFKFSTLGWNSFTSLLRNNRLNLLIFFEVLLEFLFCFSFLLFLFSFLLSLSLCNNFSGMLFLFLNLGIDFSLLFGFSFLFSLNNCLFFSIISCFCLGQFSIFSSFNLIFLLLFFSRFLIFLFLNDLSNSIRIAIRRITSIWGSTEYTCVIKHVIPVFSLRVRLLINWLLHC